MAAYAERVHSPLRLSLCLRPCFALRVGVGAVGGSGLGGALRLARRSRRRCPLRRVGTPVDLRTHTHLLASHPGDDNRYTSGALSARKRETFIIEVLALAVGLIQRRTTSSFAPHRVSLTAPLTHVIHVQRRDGARSTAARGLAHANAPLPAARAHQAFRSDSALSICSQTPVVAAAVPG